MNSIIFKIVSYTLYYVARRTRLTYNEINVIVYYFIIPFSWLVMLDIIFKFHYLKITFLVYCFGFFVGCRNFKTYSDWLFYKSVSFLNYFNRFGSNYVKSSVFICVSIPILFYLLLFLLIFR